MSDVIDPLRARFGTIIEDLPYVTTYFERLSQSPLTGSPFTGVRCHLPTACIDLMDDLDHPLFDDDGVNLLLINEVQAEGVHCLAVDFPFPGCVVFVDLKGGSDEIVFENLNEFLNAAENAIQCESSISRSHKNLNLAYPDQAKAERFIADLLHDGEPDDNLYLIVQTYNLGSEQLVDRMLNAGDMYLMTAIAKRIAQIPSRDLYSFAKRCIDCNLPQVSKHGKDAVAAIEALL